MTSFKSSGAKSMPRASLTRRAISLTAPQIREMSYRFFVAKGNMTAIDKMHDQVEGAATPSSRASSHATTTPDFNPGLVGARRACA